MNVVVRIVLLSLLCGLYLTACGTEADGGAEECASQVANLSCPAGTVPKLATQASGSCSGSGSADFINNSGDIAGSCQSQGSCDFVCEVEDLTAQCGTCGIASISADGIICSDQCASVCGDMICDAVERDAGDCPQDCAMNQMCVPGTARCQGNIRQVCRPDGLMFDIVDCPTGQVCQGEGECVSDASCNNNQQDPSETDIDCGGSCPNKCGLGRGCLVADDCESNICNDMMTCDVVRCLTNQRVQANMCVPCLPGQTNDAGDDPSGPDTPCEDMLCETDQFVQNNVCVDCPAGSSNTAGDNAAQADTTCDGARCPSDQRVQNNMCVACPAGTTNEAGDDASMSDTQCDAVLCMINERVVSNLCVSCDPGFLNDPGDNASMADTMCDPWFCAANEFVQNNACVACAAGLVNAAGDDASGPDTSCHADDVCYMVLGLPCSEFDEAFIKASNPDDNDEFGNIVVLSGNTLAVGVPSEDSDARGIDGDQTNNSSMNSGAVYVFERDPATRTWSQQAYLKASNTDDGDGFGDAIALDGDTLVVGAPSEDSSATGINGPEASNTASNSGAVYVFVRDPTTQAWNQQAYVKASNTGVGDRFGASVDIDRDVLVVGAPGEDSNATGVNGDQNDDSASGSGAVYVFERDPATQTWSQQAYLKASNTDDGDGFGDAIALDGDTLVVGAPSEDSSGSGVNPIPNAVNNNNSNDSGVVYVFVRGGNGDWGQQAFIKAPSNNANNEFGSDVTLDGDTLAVGEFREDTMATNSGAAHVYVRNATLWTLETTLKGDNPTNGDEFGRTLDLDNDTLVVGSPSENSAGTGLSSAGMAGGPPDSGAAYIFVRNATTWSQVGHIKSSTGDQNDNFGFSVAVHGATLAVGATREDSDSSGVNGNQNNVANDTGAVYVRRFMR